ncbi:NALCN channel auxiliary factor 2-like isoform X2 [Saccoglossus kowalevskii]|uniref:Transmembrane protein FAM155A-like isoform X2 n=1 Tax=Saccoglossus kowalevskii TaxID=10224 RepID=A0ABM0MSG0_SACKO|nr:PREDICTED: transmembrane protein FAM155A-like isoform X2 [Saccoglossus kowalevskii]
MTLGCYNGSSVAAERPYQEVLQRWRLSLASLLFFTILLSNHDLCHIFAWQTCSSPSISEYFERFIQLPPSNDTGWENQCFHFSDDLVMDLCNQTLTHRTQLLQYIQDNVRLRFCTSIPFLNLFSNSKENCLTLSDPQECSVCMHTLQQNDSAVRTMFGYFADILDRYDCNDSFSVLWQCEDCLVAYKDWMCAMELGFYENGEKVLPCLDICHKVAAQCPYLLPNFTYTGLPVFFCPDYRDLKFNPIYGTQPTCFRCSTSNDTLSEQRQTSNSLQCLHLFNQLLTPLNPGI